MAAMASIVYATLDQREDPLDERRRLAGPGAGLDEQAWRRGVPDARRVPPRPVADRAAAVRRGPATAARS